MTARNYKPGSMVISRETNNGLVAGWVYVVAAVRGPTSGSGAVVVAVRHSHEIIEVEHPTTALEPVRIEAYGVRGTHGEMWRRTFVNTDTLTEWCERELSDVVVHGQRYVPCK
jgi:hypothetical protein